MYLAFGSMPDCRILARTYFDPLYAPETKEVLVKVVRIFALHPQNKSPSLSFSMEGARKKGQESLDVNKVPTADCPEEFVTF